MNHTSMMTLTQAHALLQARLPAVCLMGDGNTKVQRVHSDTRTLKAGDLFVALHGERFDGHHFLPQARAAGAAAAIAQGGLTAAGLPGLEVPDTLQALGALAAGWRAQWGAEHQRPLIAVTGSNGKTTVTHMLAAVLRAHAGPTAAWTTPGNWNNAIGVPLTLLRLTAAHRIAAVELGMNHPGEIANLADMTQPTIALVNNAQREHLEFMHTVEAVARENGSVLSALPAWGTAVFPADDAFTPLWRTLAGSRRCITFGKHAAAHVHCLSAQWQEWQACWNLKIATPQGTLETHLAIAGQHNVINALAAVACAVAADIPLPVIGQGLAAFRPVAGRSHRFTLHCADRHITVVDDSYNANPDSVRAAIELLATLPAPRLLVLGDMGEVGVQGAHFHAEAAAQARASGIETILTLGPLSAQAGSGAQHCVDMATLIAQVQAHVPHMGSILVKGSRAMRLEQVVQALNKEATPCS